MRQLAAMLGKLLITISGAHEEILQECPTERVKFQSLGWAVLITSGIATVSMWFALANALGLHPALALPLALLWGLVIMGIDRWMITSIPAYGSRRWAVAVPRVLLAVLLGSIISTPIVLRIFQPEINNEIAQLNTQRTNSYLASQEHSQITAKVNYWQAQVTNLQNVINSGGQAPLNFSADPQISSLTTQLNNWIGLEQTYYNQWQCQLYGIAPNGLRCKPGNGPLAQNSHQSYEQAKQQVATINSEITARKNALTSDTTAAAAARLQEAQKALPTAQAELQNYRTQQDNLRNQYETTLPRNGLLIRLQALDALPGVQTPRFFIFLLFLLIECLPVTVKLMQRPGNYEKVLEKAREYELKRAFQSVRNSEGLPGGTARRENLDEDVSDLWQTTVTTPGRSTMMPGHGGGTPFDILEEFPGSVVPPARTDMDLHALGVLSPDDSPETRGGIPLHFDDDEA
jgi:hypothetical protein